nr:hypothetical protein CFP56_11815 [Quercus suber]
MPFTSRLATGLLVDPSIGHGDVQLQTTSLALTPRSGFYDVLSTRSSDLQGAASFNATAVLAGQQGHTLALLTIVTSSVSFITTLFAIYWFFMMRRNFRRSLVALLIVADLVKSLCLMVQSAAAISPGGLHTTSGFCQVTGYVFLASSESCGEISSFFHLVWGIADLSDRYHRLPHESAHGPSNLSVGTPGKFRT